VQRLLFLTPPVLESCLCIDRGGNVWQSRPWPLYRLRTARLNFASLTFWKRCAPTPFRWISRMKPAELQADMQKIGTIIEKMADPDIFVWLGRKEPATESEVHRAATVVADRLYGAVADPIIRNAQERRQLAAIAAWLEARGYSRLPAGAGTKFNAMPAGTFSFRLNVPVKLEGGRHQVNIPVDAVIMPKTAKRAELPLFIKAKSAGDFTNVNKRRKEEAVKMTQLRSNYGTKVRFVLFLCGYFDSGYLGYEAAEGID